MGTYEAIAATGQAIRSLLADACPRLEFPEAQFDLYQARNFQTPMDEGISLYLFRVAVNGSRRNQPPLVRPNGKRYRPPLALDLWFLLTAWAQEAMRQYHLLGWAMRVLEDNPILPSGYLNHTGTKDAFRGPESVEIVCDALSVQDMASIWEMAKHKQQPSAVYVARMVGIDSEAPLPDSTDVQTRALSFARELT